MRHWMTRTAATWTVFGALGASMAIGTEPPASGTARDFDARMGALVLRHRAPVFRDAPQIVRRSRELGGAFADNQALGRLVRAPGQRARVRAAEASAEQRVKAGLAELESARAMIAARPGPGVITAMK